LPLTAGLNLACPQDRVAFKSPLGHPCWSNSDKKTVRGSTNGHICDTLCVVFKILRRKHVMTTKNTLGKAAVVVLLATLVSACSSNAAKEEAAAQAATERAAAEQAAAAEAVAAEERAIEKEKAMVMQEQREAKRRLMDAASAAGTVFLFDYDSSTLSDDARAAIDAHVALLMSGSANARLEGHTDERGTREYNLALGERRANAVRDYMVVRDH
jgi:peptidoglycan-associated lipoprotein